MNKKISELKQISSTNYKIFQFTYFQQFPHQNIKYCQVWFDF